MSNMPTAFSPCQTITNRWVGYSDQTNFGSGSGLYVSLGEAWVKNYDLTTVLWGDSVTGAFTAPGETTPDTINTHHPSGTASGYSDNGGGYLNSFATRMDIRGTGQYWIIGEWHDPAHPGIDYQKACTATFAFNGCTTPCDSGSIIHLPIPPDALTQSGYTSSYIWTNDPSTVDSITAFCSTPGNCGAGFDFTTPCDIDGTDPFFGTPP